MELKLCRKVRNVQMSIHELFMNIHHHLTKLSKLIFCKIPYIRTYYVHMNRYTYFIDSYVHYVHIHIYTYLQFVYVYNV